MRKVSKAFFKKKEKAILEEKDKRKLFFSYPIIK